MRRFDGPRDEFDVPSEEKDLTVVIIDDDNTEVWTDGQDGPTVVIDRTTGTGTVYE